MKYSVVVTDDYFTDYSIEREVLAECDADLTVLDPRDDPAAEKVVQNADALLVNMAMFDKVNIGRLRQCRVISRYGSGVDNVDCQAAAHAGIWVSNVPDYCSREVAEHALGLLLGLWRDLFTRNALVKQGFWRRESAYPVRRLKGKVLGIAGYGNTGKAFREVVKGLGFSRVLVFDRSTTENESNHDAVTLVDKNDLFSLSDIVSLHLPLNQHTRHFVSSSEFRLMGPDAVIINTARGGLINTNALVDALSAESIRGAALDVFETEPPDVSVFAGFDNLLLTDHQAYYSRESLEVLKEKAARNVVQTLTTGCPCTPVNSVSEAEKK